MVRVPRDENLGTRRLGLRETFLAADFFSWNDFALCSSRPYRAIELCAATLRIPALQRPSLRATSLLCEGCELFLHRLQTIADELLRCLQGSRSCGRGSKWFVTEEIEFDFRFGAGGSNGDCVAARYVASRQAEVHDQHIAFGGI